MDKQSILDAIYQAIGELNLEREDTEQIDKAPETKLLGRESKLDSLGLVNLIVIVEEKVSDILNIELTLADERAMSQKHSPFRSVQTLADYIQLLLEEQT